MTTPELPGLHALAGWLATFLVHSALWIACAWLLARGVRSAAWRARLWRGAALGGLLTASLALGLRTTQLDWRLAEPRASVAPAVEPEGPAPGVIALGPDAGAPAAALPAAPALEARTTATATSVDWIAVLVALWAAGALLGLAQLLRAHRSLGRLLAERRPLQTGPQAGDLRRLARQAGLRRNVRLSVSSQLHSPVALARGEVVVPARALQRLARDEQESLLAHELAHLARRDPQWLLALAVLERLFWIQPLLRLVTRRAGAAAELCCDEAAALWTGGQVALARCLAEVATWVAGRAPARLLVGMVAQPSALVERVETLLAPRATARFQGLLVGSWSVAMLTLLACGGPTVSEPTDDDLLQEQIDVIRARIDPAGTRELELVPLGGERVEIRLPPERIEARLEELDALSYAQEQQGAAERTRKQLEERIDQFMRNMEQAGHSSATQPVEDERISAALDLLDDCPEAGIAFHVPFKDGQYARSVMATQVHVLSLRADGTIACGDMVLLLPGVHDERLLRFHLAEIARCMPQIRLPDVDELADGKLVLHIDTHAAHALLQRVLEACARDEVQLSKFSLVPVENGVRGAPLPFFLPRDGEGADESHGDPERALNIRIKRSPALPHSQESALQFHLTGNLEPLGGRSMMTIGPGLPRMAHKLLGALFDGRDSTLECQSVVIDTLPGVLYDDVLQVIDVLLAAGYTDIRFTGRRDR